MWPILEQRVTAMPKAEKIIETKRSLEDIVAEVLELSRTAANQRKKTDSLDQNVQIASPESVNRSKEEIVNAIKGALKRQNFLWSMLEHAKRWEFNGVELWLYFPPESRALAEMLQASDPMSRLQLAVDQVVGRPLAILIELAA
jgi:hypothetical protein